MYICIYVYMYICIYVYMYICIYVYTYFYIAKMSCISHLVSQIWEPSAVSQQAEPVFLTWESWTPKISRVSHVYQVLWALLRCWFTAFLRCMSLSPPLMADKKSVRPSNPLTRILSVGDLGRLLTYFVVGAVKWHETSWNHAKLILFCFETVGWVVFILQP